MARALQPRRVLEIAAGDAALCACLAATGCEVVANDLLREQDFWLEDWEKQAIIAFHLKNPLEGYRRLTFMMLDARIVAVSPASAWRVLSRAGLLRKWNGKPSKKSTGFEQPPEPHQHWHIDVSCLNGCATFYYLCSIPERLQPFPGSLGSVGADDGSRH